jgi:hypothetical protein
MRWAGHVMCKGEMRNIYILVRKKEWKKLLGRSRHGWWII